MIPFVIVIIFVIVTISVNMKIVPEGEAWVIERLGTYKMTWTAGLHFKLPVCDKIAWMISLEEQSEPFKMKAVTKDNQTLAVTGTFYYQIDDPKIFVYTVAEPLSVLTNHLEIAWEQSMRLTTREEALSDRTAIITKLEKELYETARLNGLKVNRLEVGRFETGN